MDISAASASECIGPMRPNIGDRPLPRIHEDDVAMNGSQFSRSDNDDDDGQFSNQLDDDDYYRNDEGRAEVIFYDINSGTGCCSGLKDRID